MPGRPETPIHPGVDSPVRELAEQLRELRRASGLSYRALQQRSGYRAGTLSRAASGRQLPTMPVVAAFAEAAGLSAPERARLEELWQQSVSRSGDHLHVHAMPAVLV